MRIGIDVGGTFTDVVLIDDRSARRLVAKTLTTYHDLSEGVVEGIERVMELAGCGIEDVESIIHGTTIATNALIQKKGARTALLTTRGFRDILEIGRIQRPKEGLYDFHVETPRPLVPRRLRKEVTERVDPEGQVVVPLDEGSVLEALAEVEREDVESIAICYLFSFANPEHELTTERLVKENMSGVYVSCSCRVAPEFREFERTSSVVLNAYLQPIVDRYLTALEERLHREFGKVDLRLMQTGGGVMGPSTAREKAVHMVNSGPTGGVIAAGFTGRLTGNENLISVDMGGTSFDICTIEQGHVRVTTEGAFMGYPVKIPITDVNGIGAGGGSIAWIDASGVLNVGPMSAGSDPGPACYARGGERPTVTDANLVLGRINPEYFLGGELALDMGRAVSAIEAHTASELGMSVEDAASGIIRVVNANMCRGISVSSVERGLDLREFTMVAFGGAGPLHAVDLAREMNIPRVVIPLMPGNLSAFGLLVADTKHDMGSTYVRPLADIDPDDLHARFMEMESAVRGILKEEGIPARRTRIEWSADMRYRGQSYELNVRLPRRRAFTPHDLKRMEKAFAETHYATYRYRPTGEGVEMVNIRVTGTGRNPGVKMPEIPSGGRSASRAVKCEREVYFGRGKGVPTRVYERNLLRAGNVVPGPAVIEEEMSATVLPPGSRAKVDGYGHLVVWPGRG